MGQRDKALGTALFCIGVGASNAWWLSVTSTPFLWASSPLPIGAGSVVVHAAYLLVQIVCAVVASRRALGFARERTFLLSAVVCALGSALFAAAAAFGWPGALVVAGVGLSALGGALLFLCWMSAFTALVGDGMPGSIFLLSTALGTVLWFVTTRIDATVATAALVALPAVSAACALLMPRAYRAPACGEGSARRTTRPPLRKLLPLAFVAGLFIYELPVGFVTGAASMPAATASGESLFRTYAVYTLIIVVVAAVDFALVRNDRYSALLYRFVVPIISIGLIALALVGSESRELASALVLAGTILFEMFILTSLARSALAYRESPWRIFGFGGAVMELALLCSFVLGLYLASAAGVWLSAIALGLVFAFILAGSFDIPGRDLASASVGVPTDKEPEGDERVARFARAYGLSARETEVLALIARGRSVQATADELFVSHSTVKTHVSHIYEKAGVGNRQELLKLVDGMDR